jgi:streptogramin lyase
MRRFKTIAVLTATMGLAAFSASAHAEGEQVIQVPGFADFLAVDGKTVWTTNKGRVEQWSRKGKLAEVAVARPCGAMVIANDSLWVANCADGTLNRIDIRTGKLAATIPTGIPKLTGGAEMMVTAGAGSIWMATDVKGVIARVDPATNTVVASVTVDPGTSYVVSGYGAIWAVALGQQSIQRIDPATNTVTKRTLLGKAPGFLAAGEGAIWVQEQGDGTVARIDPVSGEVTGRVKVGDNLKWGDIDTGAGKVWLRTTDDQLFATIDVKAMTVVSRLGKPAGSGALRWTKSGVWTTAHDEHTLTWWPTKSLKPKPGE